MYTLSQRLRLMPSDDRNQGYRYNSAPRTVVLETFENLEDACLALAKKQNSRKNTDEFFIDFLLTTQQATGQLEQQRFPVSQTVSRKL